MSKSRPPHETLRACDGVGRDRPHLERRGACERRSGAVRRAAVAASDAANDAQARTHAVQAPRDIGRERETATETLTAKADFDVHKTG